MINYNYLTGYVLNYVTSYVTSYVKSQVTGYLTNCLSKDEFVVELTLKYIINHEVNKVN